MYHIEMSQEGLDCHFELSLLSENIKIIHQFLEH